MTADVRLADAQVLPAGGPASDRFDWAEAWYPVHYLRDLDRDRPTAFTLLGRELVIWWDRTAEQWRAFEDACPHRQVRLSEGRLDAEGRLECPYHGWAFTGTGDCAVIPQQATTGQAHTSDRACAKTLPTATAQGLLFVYAGSAERADRVPLPLVEPWGTDQNWVCIDTFRDLPYDALTLLENVLDPSHLPFTHHGSVGNRANAGPMTDLKIVASDRHGFQGIWPEGPRRGKLGTQSTTFIAPSLMWHDLEADSLGRAMTVVYATPIRAGACRIFARFPFRFKSAIPRFFLRITPTWFQHLGQNTVLEEDQIFLHHQERRIQQQGGSATYSRQCYLPTPADRFVLALHRWVDRYAGVPFPNEPLPTSLSIPELLERYQSHTLHCRSCAAAWRRSKQGQTAAIAIAALSWTLAPILAVAGVSAIAVILLASLGFGAAAIAWGLKQLQRRFEQGPRQVRRNQKA
ncbi:Rieske 2Fe-2S domain-containing protein [Synechococcus elongatus]|uniref:Rieske 2Fe-2S domain-containing protein n=1 Tax=Synechococcus elongatus PCC 11801 TaxID=2219813 RepID=A0AAN1QMT1_SYNEL|nr:Rieske 2Fe-2S domain-containing protein [Synechococcus elongatus]AZB72243.1 cell death suppressor protein Lls1 [Synechococcus elongatus PCC 11801]